MSESERGPGSRRTVCWLTRREGGAPGSGRVVPNLPRPGPPPESRPRMCGPLCTPSAALCRVASGAPTPSFPPAQSVSARKAELPGLLLALHCRRKPAGSPAGARAPLRVTAALSGSCRPRPLTVRSRTCPLRALRPGAASCVLSCISGSILASPRGPSPEGNAPPGLRCSASRRCARGVVAGVSGRGRTGRRARPVMGSGMETPGARRRLETPSV